MQNQPIIRLLIAERLEIIRLGLRSVIETQPAIQILGEVDCFEAAYNQAIQQSPDVILLDLALDVGHCIEQIPKLLLACPDVKILAFSSENDEEFHLQVISMGVSGIVSKSQTVQLLLKAILAIHNGEVWFSNELTKLLWQTHECFPAYPIAPPLLNHKECSLACLASQGLSIKAISTRLFISEQTVRNRLSVVYEKLHVKSKVELALKADCLGFCKSPDHSRDWDKCTEK